MDFEALLAQRKADEWAVDRFVRSMSRLYVYPSRIAGYRLLLEGCIDVRFQPQFLGRLEARITDDKSSWRVATVDSAFLVVCRFKPSIETEPYLRE